MYKCHADRADHTIHRCRGEAPDVALIVQDAGSFVSAGLDTNDDGVAAVIATTAGASSLGAVNQQLLVKFSDEITTSSACGAGQVAVPLVQAAGVLQVSSAGPPPVMSQTGVTPLPASDLIEANATSGVLCRDVTLSTFRYTMQMTITGGTGMFIGATGSFEVIGMGRFLVSDPDELTFGSVTHTINVTVTTSN